MKRIILYSILMAVGALATVAQDLSTEIYVDRTVLPEQKAAQRPSLMPSLLTMPNSTAQLQAAEYDGAGSIVNTLRGLSPSPWNSTVETTPYRGYLTAGYFPSFNLGAALGYKLIDTKKASISLWGQYDGNQYARDDVKLRNHFATVRAQGYYWVDANSRIRGELGYDFSSVLHPWSAYHQHDEFTQTGNNAKVLLGWDSDYEKVAFDVDASYQYFMLDSYAPYYDSAGGYVREASPHPHQSIFGFEGGVGLTQEHAATQVNYRWIGLDFDGQLASANGLQGGLGEFHLDPYVRLVVGDLTARLGAKFSIATGDFDTGLRVAPNVRVDYVPESFRIAVWAEAGGGETLNTYSQLFALNPYFAPTQRVGRTNMPVSLGAGFNVGPISGFSLGIYGRYAAVRNWYAPVIDSYGYTNESYDQPVFVGYAADAWLVGAKMAYAYKDIFGIECAGEKGGSNHNYATWWEWLDRAEWNVKTSLRVSPIEDLDIEMGYDMRKTRRGYIYDSTVYDLGDLQNLWVGASYRITDQYTIWARGGNLTNSSYLLISGYEAQGIKGLAGIALKF